MWHKFSKLKLSYAPKEVGKNYNKIRFAAEPNAAMVACSSLALMSSCCWYSANARSTLKLDAEVK